MKLAIGRRRLIIGAQIERAVVLDPIGILALPLALAGEESISGSRSLHEGCRARRRCFLLVIHGQREPKKMVLSGLYRPVAVRMGANKATGSLRRGRRGGCLVTGTADNEGRLIPRFHMGSVSR